MPDIVITPATGKLEFVDTTAQATRRHSFTLDSNDGVIFDAPFSASSVTAPLNIINVTVNNSNVNYPFVLAASGETGPKALLMDGAGGTYNPSTNTATIDISGNSATTTLASNSSQLNGQAASYYTNIPARLGYTPANKAGDTITGDFTVNFTNTLASANYAIATSGLVTSGDNRGGFFIGVKSPSNTSRGTSSVRLFSNQGSTTASNAIAANSTDTSVIVFL